jgi:hypothetical protein
MRDRWDWSKQNMDADEFVRYDCNACTATFWFRDLVLIAYSLPGSSGITHIPAGCLLVSRHMAVIL